MARRSFQALTAPRMLNSAVATSLDPERVAKLMQGLGLCLFCYQQIEGQLKFLLPHMRKPGMRSKSSAPLNWRELIDSRVTLGPLVEELKKKTDADSPDGFKTYLQALVDQRNDLVHHLLTDPARTLHSPDQLEAAISRVREYMNFASPLLSALQHSAARFAEALDSPPEGNQLLVSMALMSSGSSAA